MSKLKLVLSASLLILISFAPAAAQTGKGNVIVTGNFIMNVPTDENNPIDFSMALRPAAGYFFADNLMAGLSVPLSGVTGDGFSSSTIGLVPFFRYYAAFGDFMVFPELGVGIIRYGSSRDTPQGDLSDSDSELAGSIGVGAAYFLSDNVAIEGLFSYQGDQFLNPLFVTGGGINFAIGFQIYLPWK